MTARLVTQRCALTAATAVLTGWWAWQFLRPVVLLAATVAIGGVLALGAVLERWGVLWWL